MLNEKLYRQLATAFGKVRVANEGAPAVVRDVTDPITGRRYVNINYGGEEYHICCPFCGDTRFRLRVNHRYGTVHESGISFGRGLIVCYNDGCDLNPDAPAPAKRRCQEKLAEYLKPYMRRAMTIKVATGTTEEREPMSMPKHTHPMWELPLNHPAMRYLAERGFEPVQTSTRWNLYYCPWDENPFVAERIIIPITMHGRLAGWQARKVGEPVAGEPKYWTAPGTQKNRILYNYDRAKDMMFGVIVEGITDVWRVGDQGIAVLGASLSQHQRTLITTTWGETGVALMLDPDFVKKPRRRPDTPTAYEGIRGMLSEKSLFNWGLLEIVLPDDTDPGEYQSDVLWSYIINEATRLGYAHSLLGAKT